MARVPRRELGSFNNHTGMVPTKKEAIQTNLTDYFSDHSESHPLKDIVQRVLDGSDQRVVTVNLTEQEMVLVTKQGVVAIIKQIVTEIGIQYESAHLDEQNNTLQFQLVETYQ